MTIDLFLSSPVSGAGGIVFRLSLHPCICAHVCPQDDAFSDQLVYDK